MIVNVVPNADRPYALVEGICSDRALGVLLRAVAPRHAFGRYDHVIIDLTSFRDWSPHVVEQLAGAVTVAGDVGRWLAFFPLDEHWIRGADADHLHAYPDRAHAQLAMRESHPARQRRGRRNVARELMKPLRLSQRREEPGRVS